MINVLLGQLGDNKKFNYIYANTYTHDIRTIIPIYKIHKQILKYLCYGVHV